MSNRKYLENLTSADTSLVVETEDLDVAVSYVHSGDDGHHRNGWDWITIAWEHTNSAASALAWTAEVSLDGTNYVDISQAIIQSGSDIMETHNPTIDVTGDATGTFTVPIPAARLCRVTCTSTGGIAADKISWRACAHGK